MKFSCVLCSCGVVIVFLAILNGCLLGRCLILGYICLWPSLSPTIQRQLELGAALFGASFGCSWTPLEADMIVVGAFGGQIRAMLGTFSWF